MNLEQFFSQFFVILLVVKLLTQLYLNRRNIQSVRSHRHQIPLGFEDAITLEQHQKAADYTVAKSRFGSWNLLLDAVLLYGWIKLSWLDQLGLFSQRLSDNGIYSGLILFASLGIISFILNLPFQLYSTFVIEEKFGFNKMTPKLFIIDTLKQTLLVIILMTPLLYALLYAMENLGSNWWIWGYILVITFQFIILLLYPNFIAPLFNKFSPMEEGELKNQVHSLLEKTQFASKGLFVMDASIRSSHGNAYFTGLGKNKRIVFFDTLIKKLTANQVVVVLAHELGHFKHKHIIKSLVMSMFFMLIGFYILGQLYDSPAFFQGHNISTPSTAMALILFSWITPLYTFFLTPVFSWFSRKNEYEADSFAAKYSNAQDLIDALVILYKENASTLTPDPVYTRFYHSHPGAKERITFLRSLLKS